MLNSKHKKNRSQKSEDKNIQAMDNAVYSIVTIGHSEYKDVFLNKKCLRNPIKDHRIGTYEIKKFLYHALMIKHTSKTVDMMD